MTRGRRGWKDTSPWQIPRLDDLAPYLLILYNKVIENCLLKHSSGRGNTTLSVATQEGAILLLA